MNLRGALRKGWEMFFFVFFGGVFFFSRFFLREDQAWHGDSGLLDLYEECWE